MHVIIGLGNTGTSYHNTRHNVGFLALDHMADNSWYANGKLLSLTTTATIAHTQALLVKPQTYMNRSGLAAKQVCQEYEYPPKNLLIIHDDIDLPFGVVRTSVNRGAGGHNGVRSLVDELNTQAFTRIRIGIAPTDAAGQVRKPTGSLFTTKQKAVARFVLQPFSSRESKQLPAVLEAVSREVETVLAKQNTA